MGRDARRRRRGGALSSRATHSFNASLSRALALEHFGLVLPSLPPGRLCPPVPSRSNYVLWLRDLVSSVPADLARFASGEARLARRGVDVGTGASCVYPLLLTTVLFARSDGLRDGGPGGTGGWTFLATDVDPASVASARTNVDANGLGDDVRVALVDPGTGPLEAALDAARRDTSFVGSGGGRPLFDFVMTNPPFYATGDEASAPRAGDKRSRTEMSGSECVYAPGDGVGGDAGFVAAMMEDSRTIRTDVTWYTSLVAKKTSLSAILAGLRDLPGVWGNRGQVRHVEFRQGIIVGGGRSADGGDGDRGASDRARWGVAWTHERASDRCPACLLPGGDGRSFRVEAGGDEAVRRLGAFVDGYRGRGLRRVGGRRARSDGGGGTHPCVTVSEARFGGDGPADRTAASGEPEDNDGLPGCGHFLLDIFVVPDAGTGGEDSVAATVVVEAFCHTRLGETIARKISAQLPGEITRSNRRWRRLLKRGLDTG